jgi:hypothetical protein
MCRLSDGVLGRQRDCRVYRKWHGTKHHCVEAGTSMGALTLVGKRCGPESS